MTDVRFSADRIASVTVLGAGTMGHGIAHVAALAGCRAVIYDLDPAVAAAVSPDDTVFVFARAASGPKMPLAIVRRAGRDLPFQVELNESQAMAPGMSIAKFPEVIVGARISKSGDATAKPGDIEGMSVPVPVRGGPPVAVRIATVVGQEAGR